MLNTSSRRYRFLLGAASFWVLLLFAAPLMKALGTGGAGWIYLFFSKICHQEAERSYQLMGFSLAVCARCTGLYLGFWAGLTLIPYLRFLQETLMSHPRALLFFLLPMGIDLMIANTHLTRVLSGSVAAFPVAFFVALAAEQFRFSQLSRRFQ